MYCREISRSRFPAKPSSPKRISNGVITINFSHSSKSSSRSILLYTQAAGSYKKGINRLLRRLLSPNEIHWLWTNWSSCVPLLLEGRKGIISIIQGKNIQERERERERKKAKNEIKFPENERAKSFSFSLFLFLPPILILKIGHVRMQCMHASQTERVSLLLSCVKGKQFPAPPPQLFLRLLLSFVLTILVKHTYI